MLRQLGHGQGFFCLVLFIYILGGYLTAQEQQLTPLEEEVGKQTGALRARPMPPRVEVQEAVGNIRFIAWMGFALYRQGQRTLRFVGQGK